MSCSRSQYTENIAEQGIDPGFLGCLSPKTASSLSGPHCLLSCCFSCDTLSFPLCTNTYNFPALIRQNKKNQKTTKTKKR